MAPLRYSKPCPNHYKFRDRGLEVVGDCPDCPGSDHLFRTSPRQGDFWVNDAPRHAMDGLFIVIFLPTYHCTIHNNMRWTIISALRR